MPGLGLLRLMLQREGWWAGEPRSEKGLHNPSWGWAPGPLEPTGSGRAGKVQEGIS